MRYIDTRSELVKFCDIARAAGPVAIDMEFERERTYYAKLQLVQLATPTEQAIVDPLAIDDFGPIGDLLTDPDVPILLHAGGQDMEIHYDNVKEPPTNIFDTQVAAAILGMGEQPGYGDLVRRALDVHLKKGERTTDWGRRPLSDAQLKYALDDVLYLHSLHSYLIEELEKQGRRAWLDQELLRYARRETYVKDLDLLWMRVSRHRSLDSRSLGVLRTLARWREETAMHRDIPRNRVIQDDVLVDIVRRKPKQASDLSALRRLHPRELERSGEAIMEAIEEGLACATEELPKLPDVRQDDSRLNLTIDLMSVFVKHRARSEKIAGSYLATKKDLTTLAYSHAAGAAEGRLAEGWRHELIGRDLIKLLEGELTLAANPSNRYLRPVQPGPPV